MGARPDHPHVPPSITTAEARSDDGGEFRLATRSARFAAAFFDGAVYLGACAAGFGLCSAIIAIYVAARSQDAAVRDELAGQYWPLFCSGVIPALVVQWYLIARDGQTIGKKILRIKIIRPSGAPPGFLHGVFVRSWLIGGLGAIPVIGGLISMVDTLMILGARRRCLHDYAADTLVIRVRRVR